MKLIVIELRCYRSSDPDIPISR